MDEVHLPNRFRSRNCQIKGDVVFVRRLGIAHQRGAVAKESGIGSSFVETTKDLESTIVVLECVDRFPSMCAQMPR